MEVPAATRVLVTGGSGFIGRRLVTRLVEAGARVTVSTARSKVAVKPIVGAELVQLDAVDPVGVREMLTVCRPQIVFHLGSTVTGTRARDAVKPTFTNNLAATVVLLDELTTLGGCERFVQAGSLEEPPPGDPSGPPSPYAAAKAAATAYVRMYHSLYELPTTVARLFMVYGPGEQNEARMVPHVTRSLLVGDAPALSSGSRRIDWVYIDDVLEGLIRLAFTDAAVGRVVDIGTGVLTSVRDVATRIRDLLAIDTPLLFGAIDDRAKEQERVADVDATRVCLGWAPTTTLDEGLMATFPYFRSR